MSFSHAIEISPPAPDVTALLPGCDFIDCRRIRLAGVTLSAPQAAKQILGTGPAWVETLMRLRNRIVALVGLKSAGGKADDADGYGGFPVVSQSEWRLVLGFDDSHLDFRIIVEADQPDDGGSVITLTTLVRTHNWLGRSYLTAILPFHRLIVSTSLRTLGRSGMAG